MYLTLLYPFQTESVFWLLCGNCSFKLYALFNHSTRSSVSCWRSACVLWWSSFSLLTSSSVKEAAVALHHLPQWRNPISLSVCVCCGLSLYSSSTSTAYWWETFLCCFIRCPCSFYIAAWSKGMTLAVTPVQMLWSTILWLLLNLVLILI